MNKAAVKHIYPRNIYTYYALLKLLSISSLFQSDSFINKLVPTSSIRQHIFLLLRNIQKTLPNHQLFTNRSRT